MKKAFEKYSSYIVALIFVAAGLYYLYGKGIIFANFESVKPVAAYEIMKKEPEIPVLDVRTPQEYRGEGHIEGAVLIPLGELSQRVGELASYRGKKILVYCRSGHRSAKASRMLADRGFKPLNIEGGIIGWKRAALPTVK
ncbi:rhodanese-related sulfurtransferase [Hydrogenimonas sp.]|nr:rhodanese-related sulfurtransferase [Hydrogenimonas sp.]